MSDDERIQLERTRAFISYFTAKEVGGYLHPALEPRIGQSEAHQATKL